MNELLRPLPEAPNKTEMSGLRHVQRAAAELRRGVPVRLLGPGGDHILLSAELAEPAALAEMLGHADGPPVVLLARRRWAAALGMDPDAAGLTPEASAAVTAYQPAPGLLDAGLLRGLADPVAAQRAPEALRPLLREVALPPGASAAVSLAKAARLLPAVLMAPVSASPANDLMSVAASAIDAYPQVLTAGLRIVAEAAVPLDSAPDARVVAFRPLDGGIEHLAIIVGDPQHAAAPLVRVHSACLTGDLLGSLRCDCGPQLRAALARMSEEGAGVLLYLAQEGRGIGLVNKLRAYAIQDRGQDTVDANLALGWEVDERSFSAAAIMLQHLGIRRIRLLTNNPAKLAAMTASGVEVVSREPHVVAPNGVNDAYLMAKSRRLGHLLP